MIHADQYQSIIDKVQLAQQFDQPVVLLWLETDAGDDGDAIDRVNRMSACHSSAETLGIISRANSMMNTVHVFDIGLNSGA